MISDCYWPIATAAEAADWGSAASAVRRCPSKAGRAGSTRMTP